jgi:hypothetical protein
MVLSVGTQLSMGAAPTPSLSEHKVSCMPPPPHFNSPLISIPTENVVNFSARSMLQNVCNNILPTIFFSIRASLCLYESNLAQYTLAGFKVLTAVTAKILPSGMQQLIVR